MNKDKMKKETIEQEVLLVPNSTTTLIMLVLTAFIVTLCRKDSRKRENIESMRARREMAKIEIMKQRERQQQRQCSEQRQQEDIERNKNLPQKRKISSKSTKRSGSLQKLKKIDGSRRNNENKRSSIISDQKNNPTCATIRSDELLREKMQREADRRLGSRYDLSETRCTETSSSTKKPRISHRELLLVTSKKAKALAAIKRQQEARVAIAVRDLEMKYFYARFQLHCEQEVGIDSLGEGEGENEEY